MLKALGFAMMWTTAQSGEAGFWRDPFGYTGDPDKRPWTHDHLIRMKRRYDAIEQSIRMNCRLDAATGAYEEPYWPPSPRCIEDSNLLEQWTRRNDMLKSMEHEESRKEEYKEIGGVGLTWLVKRDGQDVALTHDGDLEHRVWITWDPAGPTGSLIGVDRHGNIAKVVEDPSELREARGV